MSSGRSLFRKKNPMDIAAKGCATISLVETAIYGKPLPDLVKPEPEESCQDKIFRETGVRLTGKQARAYAKMIETQNEHS